MRRRRPFSLPHDGQLLLLRRALDPAADLGKPLDGEGLVRAAERHNVLMHLLSAAAEGRLRLSEAARRRAARRAGRRALQARLLRRVLPALVATLERACGTAPMLIKGPAVADRYHSDPALRPFVDLDLLVPRASLAAGAAALARDGFMVQGEFRAGYAERYGHDLHAVRTGPPRIDVDLHWRVGDDPVAAALDHARLSAPGERLAIEGGSVAVPCGAAQLLVLAVHLLRDPSKKLGSVNDVALVAEALTDAEWERAFADAEDVGLSWVLHRALDYARFHLDHARPRPRPAGPPPAFGPLRAIEEIDAPAARHIGWLAALPWRERGRYLRMVLVPSRAGLAARSGADEAPLACQLALHGARALRGLGLSGRSGRSS